MAIKTEKTTLGDGLKWEEDGYFSREEITVASGNAVSCLEVIGKVLTSVPTDGTADAGNTGNGTLGSVVGGLQTKIGTYSIVCIAAAANGGRFAVVDPDGNALADAEVGVAYAGEQLSFDLADGATDFAVGDTFTVAVTAGSGKVKPLSLTATDGSNKAAGFMIADVDATLADVSGVIIAGPALAVMDNLGWPDGITADQKTAAIAQLETVGIKAVGQA